MTITIKESGQGGLPQVRIGMVSFINTAPIYEVWKKTVQRPDWQVIAAPPSVLNRLLFTDELELGCVSSYEYAVHPWRYRILSDLSISASGPVGSVFLFSRVAPEQLNGQKVLLSGQSQTSVSLTRIILEEFYQVVPRYSTGDVRETNLEGQGVAAVLAIGDDALRIEQQGRYPVKLDLGEVWHRYTGLPFVFALWTVREEFCIKEGKTVGEIHRELLRCLAQGRRDLEEICRAVAPRIPMSTADCLSYLRSMEYDLGGEKLSALTRFFGFLIRRGEGHSAALPLKIFRDQAE